MKHVTWVIFLAFPFLIGANLGNHPVTLDANELPVAKGAPLLQNLGNHHHFVTTRSKRAQKFFNQGLILVYGFHHAEAIRSFEECTRIDPDCAMGYWGIALAHGPNINAPMTDPAVPLAYRALQKAIALAPRSSKKEQAFIAALSKRYGAKPLKDRSKLDLAYADSMRLLAKSFPEDTDAKTLFAEALMDTMPWDYWTKEGKAKPQTTEVLTALETVLRNDPNHPGANHYYIHAVEASPHPEKGLASAHRLATIAPGAGHLVHMPAHIYLRLGMYHEASQANINAIAADRAYVSECRRQGFYPTVYTSHNMHFLAYSASMEGRYKAALEAAKMTADHLHKNKMALMPVLQWLKTTPLCIQLRFGEWDAILDATKPEKEAVYELGFRHYARGVALARKKQPTQAQDELRQLQKLIADKRTEGLQTPDFPGPAVLSLAAELLQGEVHASQGKFKEAIVSVKKAVDLQDSLPYMEPPFWYFSVRQRLGNLLYQTGEIDKAILVYQEDLKRHPKNGWSLFGLLQCYRAQGNSTESYRTQEAYRNAWIHADTTLTGSCF